MRRIPHTAALAAALLLTAAAATGRAAPGAQDVAAGFEEAGDAAHGRELYVRLGCYQCHNLQGQGSAFAGPRLLPGLVPPDLFVAAVWEPRDQMPPYSRAYVSAQDLADIYAYLGTLPPPRAVDTIPLLAP